MKYRKKPVVIEAVQWTGKNYNEISEFTNREIQWESATMSWEDSNPPKDLKIFIETLEGKMMVSDMDYVIRGVNGEYYPCKPDIFDKTYEKIEL